MKPYPLAIIMLFNFSIQQETIQKHASVTQAQTLNEVQSLIYLLNNQIYMGMLLLPVILFSLQYLQFFSLIISSFLPFPFVLEFL